MHKIASFSGAIGQELPFPWRFSIVAAEKPLPVFADARLRAIKDSGAAEFVNERNKPASPTVAQRSHEAVSKAEEPPVVARLVVEIRSDGSRTIARGGLEDALNGQRVAVEAHGSTPMALALSLAKSLMQTPVLARQTVRALLQARSNRKR